MKWVKAVRWSHVCDNDQNWPTYIRIVEYRLRSDGAMYYQLAKEHWGEIDGYMGSKFGRFLEEPLHSVTFTDEEFSKEVSRQVTRFEGTVLFVKSEEELNENVKA